jgi:MerR family transcriptional regulator, light-induced transcriptional regulator
VAATSESLTIGQVSALLGVPVPTLRSWHRRYAVALPERSPGGHRRYRQDDVAMLQALTTAVSRGIAPSTAVQVLGQGSSDLDGPLTRLGTLLERAAACDQQSLTEQLDDAESELGTDAVVDRLLVPLLREIGRRWELGTVDVGVEHLTTAAARRWVARRIGTTALRDAAPVVLAAAPGNAHTVALEAFGLLLDRRGWPTCQLGADTPVAALVSSARTTRAQAAVVTAHQLSRSRAAVEALRALEDTALRLYYAGAAFDSPRRRRAVPGTYLGVDLPAAADRLAGELTPAAA